MERHGKNLNLLIHICGYNMKIDADDLGCMTISDENGGSKNYLQCSLCFFFFFLHKGRKPFKTVPANHSRQTSLSSYF